MVASSGGTDRPGALRRLNAPRPAQVRTGKDGTPAAVRLLGVWLEVLEQLDCYRTDDRWWTDEPVERTYYSLLLEDGRTVTVFCDDLHTTWWEQKYG